MLGGKHQRGPAPVYARYSPCLVLASAELFTCVSLMILVSVTLYQQDTDIK